MKKILQILSLLGFLTCDMQCMTPDLKRQIDARITQAKAKNINLFSDKRCSGDCLGKVIDKYEFEKMVSFLGVKPEEQLDAGSTVNSLSDKEEITVFVSNSMPKAALKGLVIEAGHMKNQKVRFVIQGMVEDSMLKTAALVEEIGHALEIDPKLFEVHKIKYVPVFMTTKAGKVYCLQGNVTLDFAVLKLSEKTDEVKSREKKGPQK